MKTFLLAVIVLAIGVTGMAITIIVKKDGKFYAQYEAVESNHCGKWSKTFKAWKNLKREIVDQRDGNYEVDYFDKASEAERALRDFAESKSEGKVIKEFEL